LVLDQIQKLKGLYKQKNLQAPNVFSKIEEELKKELNMLHPEVKISNPSQVGAIHQVQKLKSDPTQYRLKSMHARITAERNSLEAEVKFQEIQVESDYHVAIDPRSNKLKGIDLFDQTYLLYHHIASGNHEDSYLSLQTLLLHIEKIEAQKAAIEEVHSEIEKLNEEMKEGAPDFNNLCKMMNTMFEKLEIAKLDEDWRAIHKEMKEAIQISKKEKLEFDDEKMIYRTMKKTLVQLKKDELKLKSGLKSELKLNDEKKVLQTVNILLDLAAQFREIDKTRSGLAKQLFLLDLAAYQLGIANELTDDGDMKQKIKEALENMQLNRSIAKQEYHNMHVEFYLPEDHIWVSARKQLKE